MQRRTGLEGQTVGKYRVLDHLGRGGMADVYRAYQPSLDRYVALKVMNSFLAREPGFLERFEREAKNVAALRHPNIIQVYDFDIHDDMPYMVMEFVEGGTLKTYLEQHATQAKRVPLGEGLLITRQIGEALAYAHRRHMIHRDIKPANVLLDTDGRVILTDFGIAKLLTGPSFTATGATVGTPAYMSPELGLGRPGDHRSDVYALGVMLYQLATGQLPYDADTPLAVMLKHVNEPLPLPRAVAPDLPEALERLILKCMAKNPDDRFQTASEMLAQLEQLDGKVRRAGPPGWVVEAERPTTSPLPSAAPARTHLPTLQVESPQAESSDAIDATQLSETVAGPRPKLVSRYRAPTGASLWLVAVMGVVALGIVISLAIVKGGSLAGASTQPPIPAASVAASETPRVTSQPATHNLLLTTATHTPLPTATRRRPTATHTAPSTRTAAPATRVPAVATAAGTEALNWRVDFNYRFSAGVWTPGTHTYVIDVSCPNLPAEWSGTWTANFEAADAAALLPGDVYLRINRLVHEGSTLTVIHPSQSTVAEFSQADISRTDAELVVTDCTATIRWDDGPPETLMVHAPYQP